MEVATKENWNIKGIPKDIERFHINLRLTQKEFSRVRAGHIPQSMDDKWFSYFEGNRLYIYRSWTGYCRYIVEFSKYREVSMVTVNRNYKQYTELDTNIDKLQVKFLIKSFSKL